MPKYCIRLHQNFRHGGGLYGHGILRPGDYRVPEDISETMGERAMREAGATICDSPVPRKAAPPSRRARRRPPESRALDSAPETTDIDAAPESQSALD